MKHILFALISSATLATTSFADTIVEAGDKLRFEVAYWQRSYRLPIQEARRLATKECAKLATEVSARLDAVIAQATGANRADFSATPVVRYWSDSTDVPSRIPLFYDGYTCELVIESRSQTHSLLRTRSEKYSSDELCNAVIARNNANRPGAIYQQMSHGFSFLFRSCTVDLVEVIKGRHIGHKGD